MGTVVEEGAEGMETVEGVEECRRIMKGVERFEGRG